MTTIIDGPYLVTDTGIARAAGHDDLASLVAAAATAGVTTVQIREKDAPARDFLAVVEAVAAVLPEGTRLLVNDRVDVYLAARAHGARVHGVHIGQSDLPVALVRSLIGPDAILGLSAARPEEIRAAEESGVVDYLGVGAVHATTTKKDAPAPLGLDGFAERRALTSLPVVAIGGLGPDDAAALRRAGADSMAVVSLICAAADPAAAAAQLHSAWMEALP